MYKSGHSGSVNENFELGQPWLGGINVKTNRISLWFVVLPALIASLGFWASVWGRPPAGSDLLASDEVKAAPNNYKVHFEDAHIRLVEEVVRPGETEKMHTNPYPSVVASDEAMPKISDTDASPKESLGPAPKGEKYPTCETIAPEGLHAITNNDTFPLHVYRVEFKRIDGDAYKTNWQTWYPWMLKPIKPVNDVVIPANAKPFSAEFPYSIAYDSYIAAPNNHTMRYQDKHVRFLEVAFRGGERENLHGHPYSSVFAHDVGGGGTPPASTDGPLPEAGIHVHPDGSPMHSSVGDIKLDPTSQLNNQNNGLGPAPPGMQWPTCNTAMPQAPHKAFNGNPWPSHFYRIEFTRVDGDGIKTEWKKWYPAFAKSE